MKLLEVADDGRNDTYTDEDGNIRTDHDVIARSRLRVDTRKWLLSKALPKIYGDKIEATHTLSADNALVEIVRAISNGAAAKLIEGKAE